MKIEIEVPDVNCDFDRVELRQPLKGDYYWDGFQWAKAWMDHQRSCRYLCVTPGPAKKYRTPSLPGDWELECEFSCDGVSWSKDILDGWEALSEWPWLGKRGAYKHARIEVKDEN
jgi:hypothetical protein